MTDIYLLITDQPLYDAIAEQIVRSGLGAAHKFDPTNIKNGPLVIDAAALDKKNMATLTTLTEKQLLLLGAGDDLENITESFAKPLRLGHLLTRLRYYIETAPRLRDRVITFGGYRLEIQNRRLTHINHTEPLRLTEKETALLVFLADSQEPATRRDILASVWGYDEKIDTHTLETHIYQLRRKFEEIGENALVNEAGAYRLTQGIA